MRINLAAFARLAVAAARDSFTDAVVRAEFLEHVRAGRGFGRGLTQAAVAAQFQASALSNPAASGVTLLVFSAVVTVAAAEQVFLSNGAPSQGGFAGYNLLLDGTTGVGLVVGRSAVALLGGNSVTQEHVAASAQVQMIEPGTFVSLPAGRFLSCEGQTVNIALAASYKWVEV